MTTGRAAVERIVSEAGIFRAAAAETEMPSEEVPAGTTDRALAPAAVAVPPACGAEALVAAEVVSVVEAVVGGAGRALAVPDPFGTFALACLSASVFSTAQQSTTKEDPAVTAVHAAVARRFDTPQQAADALIAAAQKFDVTELF
ncbi:MAG: hypothetical protein WBW31_24560 [Candidatus Sulfotelmatobacter sp.]